MTYALRKDHPMEPNRVIVTLLLLIGTVLAPLGGLSPVAYEPANPVGEYLYAAVFYRPHGLRYGCMKGY